MNTNIDYLPEWRRLSEAADASTAFRAHFLPLAETDQCKDILTDVSRFVESIEIVTLDPEGRNLYAHDLIFTFREGELLSCCPAALAGDIADLPVSYQTALKLHNGMSFPDDHFSLILNGYHDGESTSNFDSDFWPEEGNETGFDPETLVCPIDYHSSFFLFHPTAKKSSGEPALGFFDTGDGELESPPANFGAGGVFLRLIGESLMPQDPRCRLS